MTADTAATREEENQQEQKFHATINTLTGHEKRFRSAATAVAALKDHARITANPMSSYEEWFDTGEPLADRVDCDNIGDLVDKLADALEARAGRFRRRADELTAQRRRVIDESYEHAENGSSIR